MQPLSAHLRPGKLQQLLEKQGEMALKTAIVFQDDQAMVEAMKAKVAADGEKAKAECDRTLARKNEHLIDLLGSTLEYERILVEAEEEGRL